MLLATTRRRRATRPPRLSRRRPPSPGALAFVVLLGVLGCADTSNISRADTPPALLAIEDSLAAEHFGGLVAVEQPDSSALHLVFRDPQRCGQAPPSLPDFAVQASARALALYRPPRFQAAPRIRRVSVRIGSTHRFGEFVWATTRERFAFAADSLRSHAPPPPRPCGRLHPIFRPDSTPP